MLILVTCYFDCRILLYVHGPLFILMPGKPAFFFPKKIVYDCCVVNCLIFEEAYLFGSATQMQKSP